MAWIESHETLREHPKTKRAAKLLNVSLAQVVGHLHLLWWWCLNYAQDGDLSRFDCLDVAEAAGWADDPNQFVDALVTCGPGGSVGFLERVDGRLVVHDWDEYAGRLIERRQADAERKRRSRSAPSKPVHRTSGGHPPDGAQTAHVPNRTIPNLPNQTEPDTTQPDDDARAREDDKPPSPPDETADDTPARRQVIEHYCRAQGRTPYTVSEADKQDIEKALELTGGDPAHIIQAMDAIMERRRRGGRAPKVASFRYFLRVFESESPAKIAAARASPRAPQARAKTGKYDKLLIG